MTPDCRRWTEEFVARLTARADLYDRVQIGREAQVKHIEALRLVIGGLQDRIAAAPARRDRAVRHEPLPYVDPFFGGDQRQQHLNSAAVCRRLGYEDLARTYEQHAAAAPPSSPSLSATLAAVTSIAAIARAAARNALRMPAPPPEPTPFVAGPQMDMFG